MQTLGVIGGSGLYDFPGLSDVEEVTLETPFGAPSSPIVAGTLGESRIAFIARHGRGHAYGPSDVPYRANIHALLALGASHVLSVSAVGSLREDLPPRRAVVPDQIIDRTTGRVRTFFDRGVVAHVGMADPFCSAFRQHVIRCASSVTNGVATGGTYLCIEGPQFSTRAESRLYRAWGASVIGMTAMPEVRLAREAGLCYALLAMVTDYDVWHDTEADVSVDLVKQVLAENIDTGRQVIRLLAKGGLPRCDSACGSTLDGAIITSPESIPDEAAARIELLRR